VASKELLSCVALVTDSGPARIGKAKDASRVNVNANSVSLGWSTNGQGCDNATTRILDEREAESGRTSNDSVGGVGGDDGGGVRSVN
jgi:hypothetical protein